MEFLIVLFVIIVGSCYLIAKSIGNAIFPKSNDYKVGDYIDKSVHHHHYHVDNRSIHFTATTAKEAEKNIKYFASEIKSFKK